MIRFSSKLNRATVSNISFSFCLRLSEHEKPLNTLHLKLFPTLSLQQLVDSVKKVMDFEFYEHWKNTALHMRSSKCLVFETPKDKYIFHRFQSKKTETWRKRRLHYAGLERQNNEKSHKNVGFHILRNFALDILSNRSQKDSILKTKMYSWMPGGFVWYLSPKQRKRRNHKKALGNYSVPLEGSMLQL